VGSLTLAGFAFFAYFFILDIQTIVTCYHLAKIQRLPKCLY